MIVIHFSHSILIIYVFFLFFFFYFLEKNILKKGRRWREEKMDKKIQNSNQGVWRFDPYISDR